MCNDNVGNMTAADDSNDDLYSFLKRTSGCYPKPSTHWSTGPVSIQQQYYYWQS